MKEESMGPGMAENARTRPAEGQVGSWPDPYVGQVGRGPPRSPATVLPCPVHYYIALFYFILFIISFHTFAFCFPLLGFLNLYY